MGKYTKISTGLVYPAYVLPNRFDGNFRVEGGLDFPISINVG